MKETVNEKLIQQILSGIRSAQNYIEEDLGVICDETMEEYANSVLDDLRKSETLLEELKQALAGQDNNHTASPVQVDCNALRRSLCEKISDFLQHKGFADCEAFHLQESERYYAHITDPATGMGENYEVVAVIRHDLMKYGFTVRTADGKEHTPDSIALEDINHLSYLTE